MSTRRLTEGEFKSTFAVRMVDVTGEHSAVVDIWPYVAAVPLNDLEGHEIWDRSIEHVYRGSIGRYDHVLVMTKTKDVFLVIVVDRHDAVVYGHRLLDLRRECGLSG